MFNDPSSDEFLQAYAERSRKLDSVLTSLTKEFCKTSCPASPIGCCHFNFCNSAPHNIQKLQKKEAIKNGWIENERSHPCRYHAEDEGCKLKMYKPPKCIGQVCVYLEEDLKQRFGSESERFISDMKLISGKNIEYDDLDELLSNMDRAILFGKRLAEYEWSLEEQISAKII